MNLDIDAKAFWKLSYGLYILSAQDEGKYNGQILNVAMQVTATPLRLAVCVNKKNLTYEYIQKSGIFGLSILEQDTPMKFIGTWGFKSGRNTDKMQSANIKLGETGVPLITDYSLAVIESKVVGEMDVGTHALQVGEVISSRVLKEGTALTYEYYQQVKKGKAPPTAPTYKAEA